MAEDNDTVSAILARVTGASTTASTTAARGERPSRSKDSAAVAVDGRDVVEGGSGASPRGKIRRRGRLSEASGCGGSTTASAVCRQPGSARERDEASPTDSVDSCTTTRGPRSTILSVPDTTTTTTAGGEGKLGQSAIRGGDSRRSGRADSAFADSDRDRIRRE